MRELHRYARVPADRGQDELLGNWSLYTALLIMRAHAVGKILFGEVHPKVAAWTFSPSRIQLDEMPT